MCWPWGFVCRLRYDYENFPHPGDDPKRVCIVMQNQKKFWWKKSFHRNFWPKFDIFQRSLKKSQTIVLPFTCLLMIEIRLRKLFTVFRWCKTCAHWINEHKKICCKKGFHRNFWPKFDISHRANMRKVHCVPTLSVKKTFETSFQKSTYTVLSVLIWRTD